MYETEWERLPSVESYRQVNAQQRDKATREMRTETETEIIMQQKNEGRREKRKK